MTAAQAQRIIAAVIPLKSITLQGAIDIVTYHIRRNDIAYKSHRKKAVEVAHKLGLKVSL